MNTITCTGCDRTVTYDEETKLHHCGKCVRLGERVEWCGDSFGQRLTGTVTAFDLGRFDTNRVLVQWNHLADRGSYLEARENLRHVNILDQIVEAL